ncbi:hypothetical protein JCM3765_005167 [Sporobolomyces pararoseus]
MVRGKRKQVLKAPPQTTQASPPSSLSSPPGPSDSSPAGPTATAVSEARSTPLPFNLEDVKKKAFECRQKVNGITYEACLADLYHGGLVVARLHSNIAQELVKDDGFGGTFEKAWRMISEDTRLAFVYHSLSQTSNFVGTVHHGLRRLCPELSASTLSENGGKVMIDLVRFIVQSGLEFSGRDYYALPNEKFERYFAIRKEDEESVPVDRTLRLWQLQHIHHRNRYLARFVFIILQEMNYFGEDEVEGRLLSKPCMDLTLMPIGRPLLRSGNTVTAAPSAEHALDPWRQLYKHEAFPSSRIATESEAGDVPFPLNVASCMSCRRMRDEVEELVREKKQFSFCAKCLSLDPPHRVAYCSRDCQVQDWPTHKLICGKRFQDMPVPPFGLKTPPLLPALSIDLQWKLDQHTEPVKGMRTIYCFRCRDEEWAKRHPVPDGCVSIARYAISIRRTTTASSSWEEKPFTLSLRRAIETRSEEDIKAFVVEAFPHYLGNAPSASREEGIRKLADDWDIEYDKMENWLSVVKSEDIHSTQFVNLTNIFGKGEDGKMNGLGYMSELDLDRLAALLGASCEVRESSKGSRKKKM